MAPRARPDATSPVQGSRQERILNDTKKPRPHGLTLIEVAVLVLLVVGGVFLIRDRMEDAQETGIRGSAKAQLKEAGVYFETAEEFSRIQPLMGDEYPGPAIRLDEVLEEHQLSLETIDLIAIFSDTKYVSLEWGYLDDDRLRRLSHLQDLQYLSLPGSLISDDGLAILKSYPDLRELDLQYSCVKGPGLKHLKLLPKLERLNLSDNELTDDCVSTLLELRALKKLSLNGTYVSPARLDEFQSHGIELSKSFSHRGSLAGLATGVSAAHDVPTLGTDPGMEAALASWNIIQERAYQADSQLEMMLPPDGRVTCLRVRGAKLRQEQLGAIAQISSLQNLDLAVSRFPEPEALTALNSLSELRRVDLSRTAAREVLLLDLDWLRQIESLHFRSAGLVDGDLNSLWHQCPSLRILDLSRNKLTDDAMPWILKCGDLEELSLARTGVTGKGILQLRSLSNLRRLDLRGMAITRKQLAALKKERPQIRILLDSFER